MAVFVVGDDLVGGVAEIDGGDGGVLDKEGEDGGLVV